MPDPLSDYDDPL